LSTCSTSSSGCFGATISRPFIIAYTRDPVKHFIPLQTKLARSDALNEYIQHTGSAMFAVPPGIEAGGYVGSSLFEG
jgi:deferrochelatase/peroxidase EfeB